MKVRLITLVITALTLAAIVAPVAAAGIGEYNHVQATCFLGGGRILVTSPTMSPSIGVVFGAGGALIIDPPQWVAFRPHVARWDGSRWVGYASGDWKTAQVTEAGNNLADTWRNQRTGVWGPGTTTFTVPPGYYKVYADYYWYAQYGYAAGSTTQWTPFHGAGSYMGWGDPYCKI